MQRLSCLCRAPCPGVGRHGANEPLPLTRRGSLPRRVLCRWKDRSAALLLITRCGLALSDKGVGKEAGCFTLMS